MKVLDSSIESDNNWKEAAIKIVYFVFTIRYIRFMPVHEQKKNRRKNTTTTTTTAELWAHRVTWIRAIWFVQFESLAIAFHVHRIGMAFSLSACRALPPIKIRSVEQIFVRRQVTVKMTNITKVQRLICFDKRAHSLDKSIWLASFFFCPPFQNVCVMSADFSLNTEWC